MSGAFDLSKISDLIQAEKPSAVIIMDTSVILHTSDFDSWKTNFERPLFVLPCMVHFELAHLKNKPEFRDNANSATQKIAELCDNGSISEGINRQETGLFISVPLPESKVMKSTLEQLSALVKVFGQADTELVILARELSGELRDIPVIIATLDKNLYHAVKFMGLGSHYFKGFPMKFDQAATATTRPVIPVNWDGVLQDIQLDAEKRTVQVELTLSSKGRAPNWINGLNGKGAKVSAVIAEGTGVIHAITDVSFSWVLPLMSWDFPDSVVERIQDLEPAAIQEQAAQSSLTLGNTYLDFGGAEHSVSTAIKDLLVNKINNCASPMAYVEDMPTLQDPVAVMKQFFLFEFVFQDHEFQKTLPDDKLQDFENKLKNTNNLLNWAYYWLYDREGTKQNQNISFGEFMHALRSCWSIGDTIKIDLIGD